MFTSKLFPRICKVTAELLETKRGAAMRIVIPPKSKLHERFGDVFHFQGCELHSAAAPEAAVRGESIGSLLDKETSDKDSKVIKSKIFTVEELHVLSFMHKLIPDHLHLSPKAAIMPEKTIDFLQLYSPKTLQQLKTDDTIFARYFLESGGADPKEVSRFTEYSPKQSLGLSKKTD